MGRVGNRYPEIRISNFGRDIRIWEYSYDNWKQSAAPPAWTRGESRQLIQWNMIRCLTICRCSNRHQSSVQSPECSCSKDSSRPHPTPSIVQQLARIYSVTYSFRSVPPRPGLDRRERPCTVRFQSILSVPFPVTPRAVAPTHQTLRLWLIRRPNALVGL